MTGYLLDTKVVSELVKAKPEPLVKAFIASCSLDDLYLTEITFAEIRFGIEKQPDALKRSWLQDWLNNELRPMFERRVLTIDEEVILRWRLMIEAGRKQGRTYSQPDLFIAASALMHGLIVVTRNENDFDGTGVAVINPWRHP